MRFCSRLVLPSLAAALLAVVACSSSTTGTAQPSNDDAGVCGGFGSNDAVCDSCFQASCCSFGSACKANAECNTLFDCLQSCSDSACEQSCQTMHPNGVSGVNAFFDCVNTKCATQCSGPAPTDGGAPSGDAGACGGYGSQNPTCNTCLDTSCCTQAAACGASAACDTLFNCINMCTDQTCANNCASQNQAAVPTYNAFVDCMNTNCTNACNGAPDGGPIVDAAGGG